MNAKHANKSERLVYLNFICVHLRLIEAINASNSFKDRFDAEVWLLDMSSRLKNRVSINNFSNVKYLKKPMNKDSLINHIYFGDNKIKRIFVRK